MKPSFTTMLSGALLATILCLPAQAKAGEANELARRICGDQTGSAFTACVRQQERSFNCANVADRQQCEKRKQASRECAGLFGWDFRQCTERKMTPVDCSSMADPARCERNQRAGAACRDKVGTDHMNCLREQLGGQ